MQEFILTTKNLTKKYKNVTALNNINMQLKKGEIYGLVGKNGAGKTTLLRLITGQSYPTEGELSLFHKTSNRELNNERRRIGAIIETPSFYPYMTAAQNLEYYRIQRGIPGKNYIAEALSEVGLADVGNKRYVDFSLGMKQRLGLALALMNKPELLLLDEPINGLDPFGIVEIRNLLLRMNKEKNITILISSHILSELTNLVTYYGFLDKGKMIKEISSDVLEKECNKYLELKVDQVNKMTALLETKLGYMDYKVLPDNSIHIFSYFDQPTIISELAVTNGVGLKALNVKEMNLEDYFIQLVGGEGND